MLIESKQNEWNLSKFLYYMYTGASSDHIIITVFSSNFGPPVLEELKED